MHDKYNWKRGFTLFILKLFGIRISTTIGILLVGMALNLGYVRFRSGDSNTEKTYAVMNPTSL
ncbi:MAG: putative membrane protein [Bacteroidia bacterium]|jgi:hypothetical protein